MTVRRVMGIETEYGILIRGAAKGLADERRIEAPTTWLNEMPRAVADSSQLTDEDDEIAANVVLTNGARLYVDHAHPEYSSPEVTSPHDAVVWDRAGELVMAEAVQRQAELSGRQINLYKNNTDGKGARSSTPATSRTPTPRDTAACTSSSATPTRPRPPPCSSSAPPAWCCASSSTAT